MSGAGGKWVASTVKVKDIANLRAAGYLAADLAHRLPDDGQVKVQLSLGGFGNS